MNAIVPTTSFGRSMSSREIAELTGKNHKEVLRDIRKLENQGAINERNFALVEYTDAKGEKRPEYHLDFDATMTLVTGYNAVLRAKVIARWRELETSAADNPAIPKDLPTALRAYADAVERNQALLAENATMRPKALFADAVSTAKTSILIGELGMKQPPRKKPRRQHMHRRSNHEDYHCNTESPFQLEEARPCAGQPGHSAGRVHPVRAGRKPTFPSTTRKRRPCRRTRPAGPVTTNIYGGK